MDLTINLNQDFVGKEFDFEIIEFEKITILFYRERTLSKRG